MLLLRPATLLRDHTQLTATRVSERAASAATPAAMAARHEHARRQLTARENWSNLLVGWPEDGRWHGNIGMWSTYDIDGKLVKEYPAARQFLNNGGGRITGPINIHSAPQGPGFEQRPQDGHWARPPPHFEYNEREHSRWDGFSHPVYPQNGPLRMRLFAPSRTRQAVAPFSLPLPERKQEEGAPGDALPVWLVMVLLTLPDGIRRRGMKVLYDMSSGEFMSLGLENEVVTSIDPQQAVDLSMLPPQLRAPAPPLPADPAGWLPDGAGWRGSALRVHVTEGSDGHDGCLELEQRSDIAWEVPEVSHGYRLITIPDGMYGILPERLPSAASDVPPDGLRFEFGGRLTSNRFTRASVTYGSSDSGGRLQHVSFEDFGLLK